MNQDEGSYRLTHLYDPILQRSHALVSSGNTMGRNSPPGVDLHVKEAECIDYQLSSDEVLRVEG